jgi:tRNA-Thr(GGU) m(6)t(6)A37 methyltransferase TsaA
MKPICYIRTPYKEKFGTPRQPMLVNEAKGVMEFPKDDFFSEALRGIENFSHLWLVFIFHEAVKDGYKALVRPPRFSGKEKWGVFASRSPHRPNHLGLSAVKFKSLEFLSDKILLTVEGVDLVSGTPILDIKPYIAYSDAYPDALCGPFQKPPQLINVRWGVESKLTPEEKALIEKTIALDPRPSFGQDQSFGISMAGYNVRFRMIDGEFVIEEVLLV